MYYESTDPLSTPLLQRYTLLLLGGCQGGRANLLREQVRTARSNADLLKMRSAMFECMSLQLGEAEAMDRIRSLDRCA